MSTPEVDLGNQALGLLMRGSLHTLDGTDPQAVQVNLNIQAAIREVIEEFDWPYCRVTTSLTAVNLDPALLGTWAYAHAVPSDLLALWRVYDSANPELFPAWEMGMTEDDSTDARYIFTSEAGLKIRYSSSRTGLSRFSDGVRYIMALRLAAKMCMPLTKNIRLRADLRREYTLELSNLKTRHANMEPEMFDVDFIPETIAVRSL